MLVIHQPEFLSYLGFFDKVSKADTFVIADTFQVKKNYYDNRNKIRTPQGCQWVTIPTNFHLGLNFKEVKVVHESDWQRKMLNSIQQNYSKSSYFDKYFPKIQEIINKKYDFLFDYNYELLCQMLNWFNIKPRIEFTSNLNLYSKHGSGKCLEICQMLRADTYLSGQSGMDYLDLPLFKCARINVVFHEFEHPIYNQMYEPFLPGLSAIDYLFNCGEKKW